MIRLVKLYKKQKRWSETEQLGKIIPEFGEDNFEEDSIGTTNIMSDLARTYTSQKKWTDAEPLQLKVLNGYKKISGHNTLETAQAMADLGDTYRWLGRLDEAEALNLQALRITETLGVETQSTTSLMLKPPLTYRTQEMSGKAEELLDEVVRWRLQTLGIENAATVRAIKDLQYVCLSLEKWDKIEALQAEFTGTSQELIGITDGTVCTTSPTWDPNTGTKRSKRWQKDFALK